MSSGEVQSRDELIAQRDVVIEQLQGEWAVDTKLRGLDEHLDEPRA